MVAVRGEDHGVLLMFERLMLVVVLVCAGVTSSGRAETGGGIRVIVNAKSSTTALSRQAVADMFLKKRTTWSDDRPVQPVDLSQKHPLRARFSRVFLDRDVAAVRRYWAQLVFSGRGVPPPEVADEAAVVKFVAKHVGAVGYVSSNVELAGVRAVVIE